LLVSAGCIAGFAICVQANMLCLLVITHWSVAVNVSLRIYFAADGELSSSIKLMTAYYLECIVMIEFARRVEQQRQEIFSLYDAREIRMHNCIVDSTAQSMAMPRLKASNDADLERATTIGSETVRTCSADASVSSASNDADLERPTTAGSETTRTCSADASVSSVSNDADLERLATMGSETTRKHNADASVYLTGEDVTGSETEDMSAWVESMEDGFPILTNSDGFARYIGPLLSGTKLIDLVRGDTIEFQRWLQVCVNNILEDSGEVMTTCQVKLGRRCSLNSWPAIEAECRVDEGKEISGFVDSRHSTLPIPLRFTNIVRFVGEECGPRPAEGHATAFPHQSWQIHDV